MGLVVGIETPTHSNGRLIEAIESLSGAEPRTEGRITGTGLAIMKQYGTGVGNYWLVIITDVMSEADWYELNDLSEELGAPWGSRIVELDLYEWPNPTFPGSTRSVVYTIHPEARS
ncbi:hypothetical protein [Streptomyces sp. NPDC058861]|uniref:hypothetical protein n=1 Tax=Streptomyces sp. NPDC058861 TaxID=3346653 RepID=UPI00369BD3A5